MRRYRIALGAGVLATDLLFQSGARAELRQQAVSVSFAYRPDARLTVAFGLAPVVGLRLTTPGGASDLGPGLAGTVSVAYLLSEGKGAAPFVTVAATVSGGAMRAVRAGVRDAITMLDAKATATAGKQLGPVSLYGGFAVFGGPIQARIDGVDTRGQDRYHVQIPLGISVSIPGGFDLFAEGSPVLARTLSGGVGWSF